jgi:hypothetical protein
MAMKMEEELRRTPQQAAARLHTPVAKTTPRTPLAQQNTTTPRKVFSQNISYPIRFDT